MRKTRVHNDVSSYDDWADQAAQRLLKQTNVRPGPWLVLGAADTGKTTLVCALARRAASDRNVGIVDADIGQSHIGPPTTVGWALLKAAQDSSASGPPDVQVELSALRVGGISFVGDVTPVGHLLPLTAAVVQCVQQALASADLVIIDTPGFISGPGANTLWWTIRRILRPTWIVALARDNEIDEILAGLKQPDRLLEIIVPPASLSSKSPDQRRQYRRERLKTYFNGAEQQVIGLNNIAVQVGRDFADKGMTHRLVALRDGQGIDQALGIVTNWPSDGNKITVLAPAMNTKQIHWLVVGDVYIDFL
jgi:polynucleotide 5'-hydroxyl-kinase GRC3/NOL9